MRGKPLRHKLITSDREKWLKAFEETKAPPGFNLPSDPRILRDLLWAVLRRIKVKDPQLFKILNAVTSEVTAIERYLKNVPQGTERDQIAWEMGLLIGNIASGKRHNQTHAPECLKVQRDHLAAYIKKNPVRRMRSEQVQARVLKNWAEPILKKISVLPCYCRQSRSGEFQVKTLTPAVIIHGCLAHLHGTTPKNIEKLLLQ